MKQITFLNTLRLLSTFAVVLLHSSATYFDHTLYSVQDFLPFGFYKVVNVFAVPVFVMISGCLFLQPDKIIDYPILFKKYVKRIALALLVFGLPMSIAERVFNHEPILEGGVDFLIGHSWSHMWYLYMLTGLYLLTPILKAFVNNSSKQTMRIAFAVLFFLCSILPTMEHFGVQLKSWMIIHNNPYILLYVLGYYFVFLENSNIRTWYLILSIITCVLIILFKLSMGIEYNLYYDPISIVLAVSIFLLFKRMNITWSVADKLNPYCFGIYLVHTIFTNAIMKIFHFNPADYLNAWISIPLLACLIFLMSLISCYFLRKIPFMRKHVL